MQHCREQSVPMVFAKNQSSTVLYIPRYNYTAAALVT
jgi:hypothetical protein